MPGPKSMGSGWMIGSFQSWQTPASETGQTAPDCLIVNGCEFVHCWQVAKRNRLLVLALRWLGLVHFSALNSVIVTCCRRREARCVKHRTHHNAQHCLRSADKGALRGAFCFLPFFLWTSHRTQTMPKYRFNKTTHHTAWGLPPCRVSS